MDKSGFKLGCKHSVHDERKRVYVCEVGVGRKCKIEGQRERDSGGQIWRRERWLEEERGREGNGRQKAWAEGNLLASDPKTLVLSDYVHQYMFIEVFTLSSACFF